MFVRVRMAAHFHFGPNDDKGEFRLQQKNAEWKGYSIEEEALRAIVAEAGGSDALGERILDIVCKRNEDQRKGIVTAEDVAEVWDLFKNHLLGTVELPE